MGVDPGSRKVGFACIHAQKLHPFSYNDFRVEEVGTITLDAKLDFNKRITGLHLELFKLIKEMNPTHCVIEKAFLGPNVQSALKLGEARGAILAAAGRAGLIIVEMSPRTVKMLITGSGAATKQQVSRSVQSVSGVNCSQLGYDATDALALAYSYGVRMTSYQDISKTSV